MWKRIEYRVGYGEYLMMEVFGLNLYKWCMLKVMKDYGKLADFEIEEVKKGSPYTYDKVVVSFKDLPDNGYYDWKIVDAENGEEAIKLVKKDFPNAQDITIWSSQETTKPTLKSFVVSYYVVTDSKEDKENKKEDIALKSNMVKATDFQKIFKGI